MSQLTIPASALGSDLSAVVEVLTALRTSIARLTADPELVQVGEPALSELGA